MNGNILAGEFSCHHLSNMWQIYPQNLHLAGPLDLAFDLSDYHDRLSADADRIFLSDDSPGLAIQLTEFGSPGKSLEVRGAR